MANYLGVTFSRMLVIFKFAMFASVTKSLVQVLNNVLLENKLGKQTALKNISVLLCVHLLAYI